MRFVYRYAASACLFVSCVSPCVVQAQRPAVPPAVAASSPSARDVRTLDELLSRTVSIDVTRVPIRRAIDALAESAGIPLQYHLQTIVAYPTLVTLHLVKVSLRVALERVLDGTSLTVVVDDAKRLAIVEAMSVGSVAQAAPGTVAGRVLDAKTSRPLHGVIVSLDDSVSVVQTDNDGRYRFTAVSAGAHRITARFVGFARQSHMVNVADDHISTLDFQLESSVNTLDQVVVTATGAQRYRELGHVVTQLNADSLVKSAPITTFAQLLTARVPGLQVMPGNGGMAGGEVALRIRSQTTVNLDPQPIIILDGVRYKNTNGIADPTNGWIGAISEDQRPFGAEGRSPLNDLNVNDIESVEVVKGPSASTLYGPDAANGVIVITTKRGQAGKPKWNFYLHPNLATESHLNSRPATGYWGWGHDPYTGDPVNFSCTLLIQYDYQQCVLDSVTVAPTADGLPDLAIVAKNRPQWQTGGSVSGGTDLLRYFLSAGYDSQVGSLKLPPYASELIAERLGPGALNDALRDPNSQQTLTLRSNLSADLNPKTSVTLSAGYTQATQRSINLQTLLYSGSLNGVVAPGCSQTDLANPCVQDESGVFIQSTELNSTRFDGTTTGAYRPTSWLSITGTIGLDEQETIDRGIDPQLGTFDGDPGQVNDFRRNHQGRTGTLNATARAHAGLFSFQSTLGGQYDYQRLDGLDATGTGLAPGSTSISTATHLSTTQEWSETASLGAYGEEVIGLNNRLFLTGAIRFDGSTSFGDAYHARPFPKLGISWVASDESWFKAVPGINELRFRASYGSSSRYPTSPMKLGRITSGQYPVFDQTVNTYQVSNLGNPVLRPERTREGEYGADATILGGHVDVGMSWYRRRTNDQLQMLLNPQGIPPQWANVGDVSAHGSEMTVTARLIDRPGIQANLRLTSSFDTNKLLSLGAKAPACNGLDCYAVGYPLSSVFSRIITGVADTVGNIQDSVVFPQEIVYSPVQFIGTLNPTHTYTMMPSVALYGGRIRVSTLIDRETGFVMSDPTSQYVGSSLAAFVKSGSLLAQAHTVANCCVYEPGDYTRWRELTVATDLPQRLVRMVLLSRGTVNFQVRNLGLWTKYHGGDPESVPGLGTQGQGGVVIDVAGIPQPRTWAISFDFIP